MPEKYEIKTPKEKALEETVVGGYRDPGWGAQKLKQIFIFAKLTDDELMDLYQCGEFLNIAPESHAVIEGEMTRSMFIILSGSVSVYKNDPVTGSLVRLAVLEAGANFGELSLFDHSPRSATVSAVTHCQLFHLDITNFVQFLDKWGDDTKVRFYRTCAEELAARFRKLNNDYLESQRLIWRHALRRPKKQSELD